MMNDWLNEFASHINCKEIRKCKDISKEGFYLECKYYVEIEDGKAFLLQISDNAFRDVKGKEYDAVCYAWERGLPVAEPIANLSLKEDNKVMQIYKWINGDPLSKVLPNLSYSDQYKLGIKAGKLLKQIHENLEWNDRGCSYVNFEERKTEIMQVYSKNNYKSQSSYIDTFFNYIASKTLPDNGIKPCLLHGDYHIGNLLMDSKGCIHIIDWTLGEYGNPWRDFVRINVTAMASEYFAKGQIDGYFSAAPSEDFWESLMYYTAVHQIEIANWLGDDSSKKNILFLDQAEYISELYDGMKCVIPKYYLIDEA